ncbi:unnamed protein product [Rotaria sp. Silwood2]|nr:unnamed protein product [Rotaria sp. Silwood2]
MAIHLIQSAGVAKIFRFVDNEYNPRLFSSINDVLTYELVTLEQCLEPIVVRIDLLDQIIQIVKNKCLTRDESAAIFLYTIEWDGSTLYQMVNRDLHSDEQSVPKSWLPYL